MKRPALRRRTLLFNRDYKDLLSCFIAAEVRFLLVGGYALAFHGHVRATKDIDVWVEPTPDNGQRVWTALANFGAPLDRLSPADFADSRTVVQIGVSLRRIDIVCGATGLRFEEAWSRRQTFVLEQLEVPVLGLDDLITNKRHAARLQDLADVEALEKLR